MSLTDLLWTIGLTFAPFLELRASIPYGIMKAGAPWYLVFAIAVVVNIVLGVGLYFFMNLFVSIVTKISFIDTLWTKYVERTRARIHDAVEKYGEWGLALFIGIPLPGSGVYSGVLAGYLIGLRFRKTLIAIVIGVLIAATIVTVVSVSGAEVFKIFIKDVEHP